MDQSSRTKDEIKRLERELRALRMKNEDLKDEIIDLRHELDVCRQSLCEISALRKPFSQPPPEILHVIFERTIPPLFLLDSSASFCPNSLFCQVLRQKKSIVNVCRTWHNLGLQFLYENISIRRVHQLLNLLQTLVNSPPNLNLKEMIKTVDIYCLVPQWYGQHFEQQLKVLLGLCPRITSCAFRSQFRLSPTVPLCAVVPHITSLVLNDDIKLAMLQVILELASPHVVSLSFHIPEPDPDLKPLAIHDKLFLHLEDISIWVTKSASPVLDALTQVWKMPHLKNLTFHLQSHDQPDYPTETLKYFCDVHGAGLRYLHIIDLTFLTCCRPWSNGYDILIPDLSKSCPALEHIVLSPMIGLPLAHEHLKWVDIWAPAEVKFRPKKMQSKIREAALPALQGVRILPFYLHEEYSCNLPMFIPPDFVSTPADAFECSFLEVGIRHEVGEIRYIRPKWPVEGAEEDDENDTDSETDASQGDDEWSKGDASASDRETDEDDSDGEYIPDDSDSGESDYSESDHDWEIGSEVTADWEVEMDGLETNFPWLENV